MVDKVFWYDGFMNSDDLAALKLLSKDSQVKLAGLSRSYGAVMYDSHADAEIEKLSAMKIDAGAQRPVISRNRLSYASNSPEWEDKPNPYVAWDAMAAAAKKADKLTFLCAGTLTNIAIALMRYEDLVGCIEKIIFIAGTVGVGDHGAMSESKAALDPYALKAVLKSHAPILYIAMQSWDTLTAAPVDMVRCALEDELETQWATMDIETVLCDQFARVTLDTRVRNKAEKNVEFIYLR